MSGTRRKAGQLGPQVEGYRAWLALQGYTPQTVRGMLKDLGQVGLWMSGEGLLAAQLDETVLTAFRVASRTAGRRKALGRQALAPLLNYLRHAGVTRRRIRHGRPTRPLLLVGSAPLPGVM